MEHYNQKSTKSTHSVPPYSNPEKCVFRSRLNSFSSVSLRHNEVGKLFQSRGPVIDSKTPFKLSLSSWNYVNVHFSLVKTTTKRVVLYETSRQSWNRHVGVKPGRYLKTITRIAWSRRVWSYWQPVEVTKHRSDVLASTCFRDQSGGDILDRL